MCSFMTMEEVLLNAADITHVQPLSKTCMLQWNICAEVKNQKFLETECTLSFEVLTALLLKMQPFWDAILHHWLFVPDVAQVCLHLLGLLDPVCKGTMIRWKIDSYMCSDTVSHPRRTESLIYCICIVFSVPWP